VPPCGRSPDFMGCEFRIDRECVGCGLVDRPRTGDGTRLTTALPGQFVVLRLRPSADAPALFRSYSLSGRLGRTYRISVKSSAQALAGLSQPRSDRRSPRRQRAKGQLHLAPGRGPGRAAERGIGATPCSRCCTRSPKAPHPARSGGCIARAMGSRHSFAVEARRLSRMLSSRAKPGLVYPPRGGRPQGRDYDAPGRLEMKVLDQLGVPRESDFYICGPSSFLRRR
jgi:ferredoxin-NADP reductase